MLPGKWHLGMFKDDYLPLSRGFVTYYGLRQGGGDYYEHTGNRSTECVPVKTIQKFPVPFVRSEISKMIYNYQPCYNACKYRASTSLCLMENYCGVLQ